MCREGWCGVVYVICSLALRNNCWHSRATVRVHTILHIVIAVLHRRFMLTVSAKNFCISCTHFLVSNFVTLHSSYFFSVFSFAVHLSLPPVPFRLSLFCSRSPSIYSVMCLFCLKWSLFILQFVSLLRLSLQQKKMRFLSIFSLGICCEMRPNTLRQHSFWSFRFDNNFLIIHIVYCAMCAARWNVIHNFKLKLFFCSFIWLKHIYEFQQHNHKSQENCLHWKQKIEGNKEEKEEGMHVNSTKIY